ncbi:MAG TPA: hypothetical protein EYP18_04960, partial [Desulfobacterales bacterium]|nr:hypothetical protein [Desulfobacterales bacterium]
MDSKKNQPEDMQQGLPAFFAKALSPSIAVKLASIITAVTIVGMGLLSLFILGNQSRVFEQQADAYAAALGGQLAVASV